MKQNWLDLSRPIPDLAEISQHFQVNESLKIHPLEAYHCQIKEWLEKGYSSTVIHQLLSSFYTCSKSTVERYIRKLFPKIDRLVMRRPTDPGDIADVDFGYLGIVLDGARHHTQAKSALNETGPYSPSQGKLSVTS